MHGIETIKKLNDEASAPAVSVGDLFQDLDKRVGDRRLEVTRVEGGFAYCLRVFGEARVAERGARETRVSVERLVKPTLFRRIVTAS